MEFPHQCKGSLPPKNNSYRTLRITMLREIDYEVHRVSSKQGKEGLNS